MRAWLRFAAPQAVTGTRTLLGAWALFLALDNELDRAALLLTAGVITDRLDGLVASRLHVASEFGYIFDCITDYLFYIVVPTVLALRMAGSPPGGLVLASLTLPFLAGAIRYARNIGLSRTESFERLGFPGLGTLIYAFYVVALVFLWREGGLRSDVAPWLLGLTSPVFAALMISTVRYPRLNSPWLMVAIVIGLNIMPFFWTAQLAWLTLVLGSAYVLFSPLALRGKEQRCPSGSKF
jgi:CDP-diacylglycerol---serine O-phosphatidyltransferase